MQLPHVGQLFESRYQLNEVVGEGGFAVVYRATDTSLQRDVVVKVLNPGKRGYNTTVASRFMREARVFAELQDPHIVTLFEFGRTDAGLLYMVFEYVRGLDLRHLLMERGPQEPRVVQRIVEQVLFALQEAHRREILHRDIKPANILVFEVEGDPHRVKLIDFGIAKDTSQDAVSLTKTGHLVGTLRYMSPEQIAMQPAAASSDIFSLGLVAYELLTGARVFPGTNHRAIITQQLSESPLHVPPQFAPQELRDVIDRMLARRAEDRYQSAADVLSALAPIRKAVAAWHPDQGLPETRERRPLPARLAKPPPRNWKLVGVGAAISLVGGLVLVMALGPDLAERHDGAQTPSPVVETPTRPKTPDAAAPKVPPSPSRSPTASAGCGKSPPFRGKGRFVLNPAEPTMTAYIPKNYDPEHEHPLVVMFHRQLRNGERILKESGMDRLADEERFIVLAPDSAE